MKDIVIKLTPQERMELQAIVLDRDAEQALAFARMLLARVRLAEHGGMKSHLDR